jgi:hypothetical protein
MKMKKQILGFLTVLFVGLAGCGGGNGKASGAKAVFVNGCVQQEGASRPMDQASAYCNCVADEVFGDGDISDETKNLMPTLSDKGSRIYQREDITLVRGALMSCYTKNFYKKK